VERVWGRRSLPGGFADLCPGDRPIGEVWFVPDVETQLLVKYLFTSERLSIQVHPTNAYAQAQGYRCGKDEAWLVVDAEPGAMVGIGLTKDMDEAELRAAAADGSIERFLAWQPVVAGDSFFSPSGTVHAIGGGLTLIEVQQNVDLTYRLFDYGRPRELHLEDAVAVAARRPWRSRGPAEPISDGRSLLAAGGAFVFERWQIAGRFELQPRVETLLVPLNGGASIHGTALEPSQVYAVDDATGLSCAAGADLLVAYAQREVQVDLLRDLEPKVLSLPSKAPERPASEAWPADKERRASRRFRA
jgi:mannose-6-phosphate isomerase